MVNAFQQLTFLNLLEGEELGLIWKSPCGAGGLCWFKANLQAAASLMRCLPNLLRFLDF